MSEEQPLTFADGIRWCIGQQLDLTGTNYGHLFHAAHQAERAAVGHHVPDVVPKVGTPVNINWREQYQKRLVRIAKLPEIRPPMPEKPETGKRGRRAKWDRMKTLPESEGPPDLPRSTHTE